MNNLWLSIIIATFNSEKNLPVVLQSIARQTLKNSNYEVLVVDGGSTDDTLRLARKSGAKIIHNPKIEQNHAKLLGFQHAKGDYVIFLDSDEELENTSSFKNRLEVFSSHPNINMLVGSGYKSPDSYPAIIDYINDYGDPFSLFMYHLPKRYEHFIVSLKKRFPVDIETDKYLIFDIKNVYKSSIFELTAGGSMFNRQYYLKTYPGINAKINTLNHAFYQLASLNPKLAVTINDPVVHYSSVSFKNYFNKLEWRVKNNIFFIDNLGQNVYIGRQIYQDRFLNIKKYLFIPYTFTLVLPIYESIRLAISKKSPIYLIHLPLCVYVAVLIVMFMLMRCLSTKPSLRTYGSNVIIK